MQQVIVYRNPLEAALWNVLGGPEMLHVLAGMGVLLLVLLLVDGVLRASRNKKIRSLRDSYFPLVVGGIAGLYTTYSLWV